MMAIKSSIYEEFSNFCSSKQKFKKLSLYKEQQFGLLGCNATALLYHFEDLKSMLEVNQFFQSTCSRL